MLPSSSPPISIPWRFFLLTLPIHSPSFVLFSLFSYDLCSSPQFLSPAISIPMLLGSLTLLCCYFSYIYVSPTPFSFPSLLLLYPSRSSLAHMPCPIRSTIPTSGLSRSRFGSRKHTQLCGTQPLRWPPKVPTSSAWAGLGNLILMNTTKMMVYHF